MQTVKQFLAAFFDWFRKQRIFIKIVLVCVVLFFVCCLCVGLLFVVTPSTSTPVAQNTSVVQVKSTETMPPVSTEILHPTSTSLPADTPLPTNTPSPTNTPLPPTPTSDPAEELKARVIETLGNGNRNIPRLTEFVWTEDDKSIIIQWAIDDNFTTSIIMTGAQSDIADMLKVVSQSALPDYQVVLFVGTFPLVDTFGNTSEDVVATASFNRSTVDKINWQNFLYTNIFVIADESFVHPAMRE